MSAELVYLTQPDGTKVAALIERRTGETEVSPQIPEYALNTVIQTLMAVADGIGRVWRATSPTEAEVEVGLELTVKDGQLIAALVQGEGKAHLKVTLCWKK